MVGSSLGIASGLDLSTLTNQLLQAEFTVQNGLINQKQQKLQVKISGLGQLKSSLSTFQGTLSDLKSLSALQARSVTSSNSSVVSVSGGAQAASGNYSIQVTTLAKAHKLASSSYAQTSTVVGTGTLHLEFGTLSGASFTADASQGTEDIVIDGTQNTLSGVRDAINTQSTKVTASIVNDGTGNRLVITHKSTGAQHAIKITVTDDDGSHTNASGLSNLAFDPAAAAGSGKNLSITQSATDAVFSLDGLAITKSSNTVTDVIEGVTLSLLKEDPGNTHTLSVSLDKSGVTSKIQSFVNSYNNVLNTAFKELGKYSPETQNGALIGDFTLRSIQTQVRSIVGSVVDGVSGNLRSLADIGITTNKDNGAFVLDAAKLQSALDSDFDGVAGVFAERGTTQDSFISFLGSSSQTKVGSHTLNVTQLATKGTLTGSAIANTTITTGVNDTLDFTIHGNSVSITLDAGSYSASTLASALESKLNSAVVLTQSGLSFKVTESGGILSVESQTYGSESTIALDGGNGASDLFGGAPVSVAGLNVAGTLGGASATGAGQTLTGSGDAAGLQLSITGGSLGYRGEVEFTRGKATSLDQLLTELLGSESSLSKRIDSLNEQVSDLDESRELLSRRQEIMRQRYVQQFAALDTLIGQLQSTGNYLSSQLANLPGFTKKSK